MTPHSQAAWKTNTPNSWETERLQSKLERRSAYERSLDDLHADGSSDFFRSFSLLPPKARSSRMQSNGHRDLMVQCRGGASSRLDDRPDCGRRRRCRTDIDRRSCVCARARACWLAFFFPWTGKPASRFFPPLVEIPDTLFLLHRKLALVL